MRRLFPLTAVFLIFIGCGGGSTAGTDLNDNPDASISEEKYPPVPFPDGEISISSSALLGYGTLAVPSLKRCG